MIGTKIKEVMLQSLGVILIQDVHTTLAVGNKRFNVSAATLVSARLATFRRTYARN